MGAFGNLWFKSSISNKVHENMKASGSGSDELKR